MSLYRASPKDGVAWITGASQGIGRKLALDLAAQGYTVAASARGRDDLETLAAEAAASGGRIVAVPCDVTDRDATANAVNHIETTIGPIALAIFNAGTFIPVDGRTMAARDFDATFAVNFNGVLNGLLPAIAAMKARGRGQVALVGSMTAYGGLPTSAAYGASKAALNTLASSLKFDLDHVNIRVQIINPGFVETPLTAKNEFSMPTLVSVEEASRSIVKGLAQGGFEVAFPRRLAWTLKLANALPYSLYFPLVARATGWNRKG